MRSPVTLNRHRDCLPPINLSPSPDDRISTTQAVAAAEEEAERLRLHNLDERAMKAEEAMRLKCQVETVTALPVSLAG